MARAMVTKYGMGSMGAVSLEYEVSSSCSAAAVHPQQAQQRVLVCAFPLPLYLPPTALPRLYVVFPRCPSLSLLLPLRLCVVQCSRLLHPQRCAAAASRFVIRVGALKDCVLPTARPAVAELKHERRHPEERGGRGQRAGQQRLRAREEDPCHAREGAPCPRDGKCAQPMLSLCCSRGTRGMTLPSMPPHAGLRWLLS